MSRNVQERVEDIFNFEKWAAVSARVVVLFSLLRQPFAWFVSPLFHSPNTLTALNVAVLVTHLTVCTSYRFPACTFSAEVKERVELYLCSSSGPSWKVIGRTLPLSLCTVKQSESMSKLSCCTTSKGTCPYLRHEGVWGSGDVPPLILNLGTGWK